MAGRIKKAEHRIEFAQIDRENVHVDLRWFGVGTFRAVYPVTNAWSAVYDKRPQPQATDLHGFFRWQSTGFSMSQEPKDHGEPPSFAKWLIWLFRKDTWTDQPVIASVATIIAISVAVFGVFGFVTPLYKPRSAPTDTVEPEPERKTVVLMDSPLPAVVYDPQTRATGGTNADDISHAIDDLTIHVVKETTSLAWDRDGYVRELNPDLIIIHLSAFYDQTTPADGDRKLDTFLRLIAGGQSKLIVYTRVFESPVELAQWTRKLESEIPQLRNRVQLIHVPGGVSATFRDTNTARRLKLLVKQTLEL